MSRDYVRVTHGAWHDVCPDAGGSLAPSLSNRYVVNTSHDGMPVIMLGGAGVPARRLREVVMRVRNGHKSIGGDGFTCVPESDVVAAMGAASVAELGRVSARLCRVVLQLDRVCAGLSPELYAVIGPELVRLGESIYDVCGVAGAAHDRAAFPESA